MIYIDNRQNLIKITEAFNLTIKEIIDWALKSEQVNTAYQVSLVYVEDKEMASINNENRGINTTTDVLSFPMLDYPKGTIYKEAYCDFAFDGTYLDQGELVLGDIVISLEKAKEQSEEFNHSFIREVCYLTIHSVLHLLGYDHMEEAPKKIMREREEEILQKFNLAR